MFTGIITHLGTVKNISGSTFTLSTNSSFCKKIKKGTSIAVNGVCLTVEKNDQKSFSVTIMPETKKKTMLHTLKRDNIVNLELPVTSTTLLSGHIVQGHVDGVGKIADIKEEGNSRILTINNANELSKYIVEKGSIAVNGISLTVIAANEQNFIVGIIPYTWKHTMLYTVKKGNLVNIEVDIIGKYVEKLIHFNSLSY